MTTLTLTYDDLAQRLGITAPSVRRMVYRHRWHKTRGNDGRTLVDVPEEYFAKRDSALMAGPKACHEANHVASHEAGHEASHVAHHETSPVAAQLGALVAQLATMRDELAGMAQRLATAEGQARGAEAKAEGLQAVLDVERRQVGELRQERDRLLDQLVEERRERDQAFERLNHNIDRLDRIQAEHHAEIAAVRDQLARAESDRSRAVEALVAHLALPWWRRMFG